MLSGEHQRRAGCGHAGRGRVMPVEAWAWQAGRHCGITDDPMRAFGWAGSHAESGITVRVELVRLVDGYRTMTSYYAPTGFGWTGELSAGAVTWRSIPAHAAQDAGSPAGQEESYREWIVHHYRRAGSRQARRASLPARD